MLNLKFITYRENVFFIKLDIMPFNLVNYSLVSKLGPKQIYDENRVLGLTETVLRHSEYCTQAFPITFYEITVA